MAALSVKVRLPVTAPIAVGENVTPTVQLAPVLMLAPHVLLAIAKPALATILVKLRASFPRFATVTVLAALVEPAATLPKLRVLDEKVTGAFPVPVSPTVCVPASSEMVRMPEAEPRAVGVNETRIVHDPAGATDPVQVLVWLKGAAATTLATCMGPVPVFCKVTVLALLVVFKTCEEKVNVAGETAAAGAVPTPARVTVCVEPALPESSLIVN